MSAKRVVITGMGCITPIGNNMQQFSENLFTGKSGAANITNFDTALFRTKFACTVKDFYPENFFDRKELKKLDRYAQFALMSAEEAIRHSGILDFPDLNKKRVGVLYTSGFGGVQTFQDEVTQYIQNGRNPKYFSPYFVPRTLLDLAGGNISIKYGFKGMNFSVVSACASSAHALLIALQFIRSGLADAIVVGGSEAPVNEISIGAFNAMRALSERNESPETASRPFDKNRDGFVMGEGGACMVIESLEHARQRDANILAELAGGAMNADAFHITAPQPEGEMITEVMQQALEDADLLPHDIDYINAHGTSTPLGDVAELHAIEHVFGSHISDMQVSSTKSMTGHLLGAAGITEAITAVLAIKEQKVPPTINLYEQDESINPAFKLTPNIEVNKKISAVLSNNFGFGGHNASLVLRKYIDF